MGIQNSVNSILASIAGAKVVKHTKGAEEAAKETRDIADPLSDRNLSTRTQASLTAQKNQLENELGLLEKQDQSNARVQELISAKQGQKERVEKFLVETSPFFKPNPPEAIEKMKKLMKAHGKL